MKTARRRDKHNELFSDNTARNCDDKLIISSFLAIIKEEIMKITVKDVLTLLKPTDEISLAWGDSVVQFSAQNSLYVDAYGDYVVSGICAVGENCFEVDLMMVPIKASSVGRA